MPERAATLRLCNVVGPDAEELKPYVRCPRRDETIDALTCTGCARMRSMEWEPRKGGVVICSVDEPAATTDRRADLAEAAARVLLHEVVMPVTTCVTPDVSIQQLRRLMANEGLRSVPVVDLEGKLQGLVSRTDLTTAADFGLVENMMTSRVHALPEDAPVAYAIALMAFENVSEVPVVTADGTVAGMYHALDALRWVAGKMGYVNPMKKVTANDGEPSVES